MKAIGEYSISFIMYISLIYPIVLSQECKYM